jgi:hypothetical protein
VRLGRDVRKLRGPLVRGAGVLVTATGLGALAGRSGLIPVSANTRSLLAPLGAGGLILGGAALVLLAPVPVQGLRAGLGRLLAALLAAAGAVALLTLVSPPLADMAGTLPPAGGPALLFSAAALLALDRPAVRDVLAPMAALLGLLAAAGQPAALALVLLNAGTVLARPQRGLLGALADPGPGGTAARRLTPLILLPFAGLALGAVATR